MLIILCGSSCVIEDERKDLGEIPSEQVQDTEVFIRSDFSLSHEGDKLIARGEAIGKEVFELALPVERIVLSSTTQLAYFSALEALDLVVGCPWIEFVNDEDVQQRVSAGKLFDVTGGDGLDIEKIISLNPDVVLYDPREIAVVSRLRGMGVLCVPFSEYREKSPEGRVEWLKLVGMLSDKSSEADERISSISAAYHIAAVDSLFEEEPPHVLFGSFYQGIWSAAGGASFIAQMIEQAGGQYAINDSRKGSLDLDVESLMVILEEIDFLGLVHHGELSQDDVLALDSRLSSLTEQGAQIFYCNTADTDYFSAGVLAPHLMVEDLQALFKADSLHAASYFIPAD